MLTQSKICLESVYGPKIVIYSQKFETNSSNSVLSMPSLTLSYRSVIYSLIAPSSNVIPILSEYFRIPSVRYSEDIILSNKSG